MNKVGTDQLPRGRATEPPNYAGEEFSTVFLQERSSDNRGPGPRGQRDFGYRLAPESIEVFLQERNREEE